jgi:hypothetical protein
MRPIVGPAISLLMAIGAPASEYRIRSVDDQWQLLRDDNPYFIKGAGIGKNMASVAAAGGNSVRVWGDESLGATLDEAHRLGLTVCAGIWLGQVRQGFKWADAASLARQQKHVQKVVEKYKHHPALFCWALGNEVEDPQGRNTDVWIGINTLAALVKELDPAHPTMTVLAEIGGVKIPNLHRLCPSIDMVGINSYGGAVSLPERYRKAGGTKPYLLTEFGPLGIWESRRNSLGAYAEPTSTAKAESYRRAYQTAVLGAPGMCLGSYAFLWGQKQEVTATWFSLFLADGSRLEGADTMAALWTGQPPAHRCPVIESLSIAGRGTSAPEGVVHARLKTSSPEKAPLRVHWYLQHDREKYGNGNDPEEALPILENAITRADLTGADVKLPERAGLYRLFAIVRDPYGGAATANASIRVDAAKAAGSELTPR